MKEISLNDLKREDLVSGEQLVQAYKEYLKAELGYDEFEAEFASEDMKNPYDTPYILQEYEGDYDVDGVWYEIRKCETNFCYCGMFHLSGVKPFEFYMLFDKSTMDGDTVGDYSAAKKMFVLTD